MAPFDPAELPKRLYWYKAWLRPTHRDITGVVDGDSMQVTIDMGMFEYRLKEMRVANVNAPEMSTDEGKGAKLWAINWFNNNCPKNSDGNQVFYIHTHLDPSDKYGRIMAMIYSPGGHCYNEDIVNAGIAVPYMVESYE